MKNITLDSNLSPHRFNGMFPVKTPLNSYRLTTGISKFILLFGMLFFLFSEGIAQTFPPASRCTSKDLTLVSAELTNIDPCFTCDAENSEIINATLTLGIYNKTGSTRTSFAFWGTLIARDSDGNITSTTSVNGCTGPILANETKLADFGTVQYICGTTLDIQDIYLAWTDASDNANRQCPLNSADIAPKCGTLASIKVIPPLFALVDSTTDVVCYGDNNGTIDLFVRGGEAPYTFEWSDLTGTSGPEDRNNLVPGTYSVIITDKAGCSVTVEDIIISEPEDVSVSGTGINITCNGYDDGSITVTASGYTKLELYKDGNLVLGAALTDSQYQNLSPGSYVVKAYANGGNGEIDACTDQTSPIMITEPDKLPAPLLDVDNPVCGETTGSVTITTATAGLVFSLDGGAFVAYPIGGYTGLASGSHTLVAKSTGDGACLSDTTNFDIDQPFDVPSAPAVSVDNPDCGETTGSVTITSATTGLVFSLDGGDFAGYPEGGYTVLASGSHTLVAKSTGDGACISETTNFEIDQPFDVPAAPAVSVDNPDCGETTGSVTITSAPAGLVFSLDGGAFAGYPVGGYTGLLPGSHTLVAKSTGDGTCISETKNFEIDEPFDVPAAPEVSIDNPDCGETTGSVTITTATAGLVFSLDGGAFVAYPIGGYTGLASGSHTLVAKSTGDGACLSDTTNFDIDQPFDVPSAPAVSVDNPDCGEITGSATITSATAGLVFSLDGGAFVAYPIGGYTGLASGSHTLVAKSNGDGACISETTNFEIDQPFDVPAAPAVSVDNPDCGETTGSVTITSATTGLVFSLDGGAFAAYPEGGYTGLASGSHTLVAKSTGDGTCISETKNFEIDEPFDVPAAPAVSVDNPDCGETRGSVTITSTTAGLVFSLDGGAYAAYPVGGYTGLTSGSHTLVAKSVGDGDCISDTTNFDIEEPYDAPIAMAGDDKVLTCFVTSIQLNGSATGGSGMGTFTYSWVASDGGSISEGANTATPTVTSAGTYTLTVSDSFTGCIGTDEVKVTSNSEVVEVDIDIDNITCFGNKNGKITITLSGGGGAPYYVEGNMIEGNVYILDNLSAGEYDFIFSGANGCGIAYDGVPVTEPEIVPTPQTQVRQADCISSTGGVIVDSPVDGYTYELILVEGDALTLIEDFENLPLGDYELYAINAQGCRSLPFTFTITKPSSVPITPLLSAVQPTCDNQTGTIIVTNNTANVVYAVILASNAGSDIPDSDFSPYPSGGYTNLAPENYVVLARILENCSSGAAPISLLEATNCDLAEGCTLGYWKTHTDRWCSEYNTCTLYGDVFSSGSKYGFDKLTLLQVLNLKGNKNGQNLARQSVAALLNTCSGGVDDLAYYYSDINTLVADVNNAYATGTENSFGTTLDTYNNAGCTLGGSRATTASTCPAPVTIATTVSTSKFNVYPVPFREVINIKYDIQYESPATIQIFDTQGKLLRTYNEKTIYNGKVTAINIDFRTRVSQVYLIKIITNTEVLTKKVISDK